MHSVPLNPRTQEAGRKTRKNFAKKEENAENRKIFGEKKEKTLLDWCAEFFPSAEAVRGDAPWEGGMAHRLDYETQGLLVYAKTQAGFDALKAQQSAGRFVKAYDAAAFSGKLLPGFPVPPECGDPPFRVESGFRAFGPGRRAVRPVLRAEKRYSTEILGKRTAGERSIFRLRLFRGFRHQIRCHLAWIGYPLANDPLYGGGFDADALGGGFLGLIAWGLSFFDPISGEPRRYTVRGIEY
jgi:23S rRNA pseudouridine1911/1915/1917 synthase